MQIDTATILAQIAPQMGLSVIFAFAVWRIYSDSNMKIREKDAQIEEKSRMLVDLYAQNAKLLSELKSVIENQNRILADNTNATRSLEKSLFERHQ
jgi:hypothetical protein